MNRLNGSRVIRKLFASFTILVIFGALTISGCGQKGPLYRTDTQQEQISQ